MFPVKSRPVSSKAAFKVLYQLAYITSGTAVGVATLCLEERRRQLQLVQRIADNAKRLRQSPRYYQNVSRAEHHPETERRLQLAEHADIKGPELPSIVEEEYRRNSQRTNSLSPIRQMQSPRVCSDDHVRADQWLHEIDPDVTYTPFNKAQNYVAREKPVTLAFERDALDVDKFEHNEARTRKRSLEPHAAQELRFGVSTNRHLPSPDLGDSQSRSATSQSFKSNDRVVLDPNDRFKASRIATNHGEQNHPNNAAVSSEVCEYSALTSEDPTTLLMHEITNKLLTVGPHLTESNARLGRTKEGTIAAVDVTHDIDTLLALSTVTQSTPAALVSNQIWRDTVGHLLLEALGLGMWPEVVRLGHWMEQCNLLGAAQMHSILAALVSPKTHERTPPDVLIDTCHGVFALQSFRSKTTRERHEYLIEIMLNHFKITGKEVRQDSGRFTKARLSSNQAFAASLLPITAPKAMPAQEVSDTEKLALSGTLLARAQALVNLDCHLDALDLISACGFSLDFGDSPLSFAELLERKFRAARASDDLLTYAILLRIEAWNSAAKAFTQNRDIFLRICGRTRQFSLVEELFVNQHTMIEPRLKERNDDDERLSVLASAAARSSSHLPTGLTPALAIATEQTARDRFAYYYHRLSQRLRLRVAKHYALSDVMGDWSCSRNYSTTIDRLRMLEDDLKDSDAGAARAVLLAQLDVQIRHNDLEIARETLAKLHKFEPADYDTVGRAALMLARASKWRHLDELLKLAKSSKLLRFGPVFTTKLNAIVSVFSKSHSAEKTWSFVTGLVHDYEFIPNQATTEILLGAFTSGRSYYLIPLWLRYLRVIGIHFSFDASIVVRVLTCFYRKHRPPHVWVISACTNLSNYSPCLAGSDYMKLIEEAVGFDLRSFPGLRHATANISAARARLLSLSFPPGEEKPRGLTHIDGSTEPQINSRPEYKSMVMQHETTAHKRAEILDHEHALYIPLRQTMRPTTDTVAREDLAANVNDWHYGSVEADDWAVSFNSLRASYETPTQERSIDIEDDGQSHERFPRPEKRMTLALSLKQNEQVLRIYHNSLDKTGLPVSPFALEVAVEASLRLHHGNAGPAEAIMMEARKAGMDSACGMGPLLIHQIRNFGRREKQNAHRLRIIVLRYYRLNQRQGLPVKHEVATTAASALLRCGCPQDAVQILEGIHRSEWTQQQPMDIAAMTVFLRAYAMLGNDSGVRWCVDTILAQNMRIDLKILKAFREIVKLSGTSADVHGDLQRHSNGKFAEFLATAGRLCKERRTQQLLETNELGIKLTSVLAHCANQASGENIAIDSWSDIERARFGTAYKPLDERTDITPQEEQASKHSDNSASANHEHITTQPAIERPHFEEDSNTSRRSGTRSSRLYTEFLSKDIVLPDGKILSFRKCQASTFRQDWGHRSLLSRRKRLP